MWVSSMTSTHRSVTARCGGSRNNDRTTIKQHFQQFAWNAALSVLSAIALLHTVGLISVTRADTVQYPVTAPIGSVIPPGKILYLVTFHIQSLLAKYLLGGKLIPNHQANICSKKPRHSFPYCATGSTYEYY